MSRKQAISAFWDRYGDCLKLVGIPDQLHSYYAGHVDRFIKYKGAVRLRDVRPGLLRQYLDELARHPTCSAWHHEQISAALEILFTELVQAEWATQIDWQIQLYRPTHGDWHPELLMEETAA